MSYSNVIIAPYYEDKASDYFFKELAGCVSETDMILIVDDGSITIPLQSDDLKKYGLNGKIIRLRRNIGHQCAISVGLAYATEELQFDNLVIMDSDGEDRPSDIKLLLEKLKSDVDVVVAQRTSRHESVKFKLFYLIYKTMFRWLVGKSISFGNFMVMTKSAAARLAKSQETFMHVAASVLNSKLRLSLLPLARGKRYAGKSKMSLVNLILHGIRSIMVFSESVLVRITLFCAVFAAIIFVAFTIMIVAKFAGITIVGWFSTISGILLLMLFQVASMTLLLLLLAGNLRQLPSLNIDHMSLVEEVLDV